MEVGNARPVQVPILLYWGGFPQPPIYQEEPLAYCSDDDIEDSDAHDDEQKIKTHKKNQKNLKTHKKNIKSHKNLGSMLRTAATKKRKNPKKYEDCDDEPKNDDDHATENTKNPKKAQKKENPKELTKYQK